MSDQPDIIERLRNIAVEGDFPEVNRQLHGAANEIARLRETQSNQLVRIQQLSLEKDHLTNRVAELEQEIATKDPPYFARNAVIEAVKAWSLYFPEMPETRKAVLDALFKLEQLERVRDVKAP